MPYFNTTNEEGQVLINFRSKAVKQDEQVMNIFYMVNGALSPSEVHHYGVDKLGWRCPLTSIRRSFNTLTKQGKLEKTNRKIEGLYGRMEHLWIPTIAV